MSGDKRLEEVLNGGVETTVLPSGMHVRGVRPTTEELIRRRLIPSTLRQQLMAAAARPTVVESSGDLDDDAEASAVGHEYLDVQAAAFVQEYRFPDREWRPLELTVEKLRRMSMADREHLRNFVSRAEEVAAFEPFRDDDGGPPAGEDGGSVEDTAEPAPAGPGRRRGVRAR